MTTYNTQNPLGSTDPRDLYDNAESLDEAVNSDGDTFQDRLGKSRLTWAGMENQFESDQSEREDQFHSAQSYRDAVFSDFLQASGYQDLGEYAPGIEITAHNQYVTFGGQPYLLKPSIPVPYTTSEEWTGDDFKLIGDDSLRQELTNPAMGAAMVARGVVAVDSIADLLALPEGQRKEGLRYFVKGYYAGRDVGGGEFYWDASSTAAVDGGTVFVASGSSSGRFLRTHNGQSHNVFEFGAICDGTLHTVAEWTVPGFGIYYPNLAAIQAVYPHVTSLTDSIDWAAAQQALNKKGHAVASGSAIVFNRTLTIASDQSFIGGNGANRVLVRVTHSDVVFQLAAKATLRNFEIGPIGDRYLYTGVSIESKAAASASYNIVHNIKCFYSKVGFLLIGPAYWNILTEIDCYFFKEYGVLLDGEVLGNEAGCNNNYIRFMSLSSNAQVTTIPGGYTYTYDDVTWEQAAIKIKFGHQNTFVGGEPAPSKYGVIVDERMSGNRFENMYMEHQKVPLKTGANSYTFWDSSMSMGEPDIHIDSVVIGPSGLNNSLHTRINTAPLAGARNLKAAWYFNEGAGNKVYDFSGNRKHLTLVNPNWTNEGRWGSTARLSADTTSKINPIPIDTVDWTKPFTFAACVKFSAEAENNFLLSFSDGSSRYGTISVTKTYWSFVDYDGTTVETSSAANMLRSSQDGYTWVVIHFDPVTKTLTSISATAGSIQAISPQAPRFSVWSQGGGTGVSSVTLGYRSARGLDGCFSFVGFWDRKLTLAEANDLVNMKIPTLFPAAAPVRVASQEDSVAADVPALKDDFNALLTKLKSSGLMD